ncbi:MAG: response regulator [Coprococcus catus]|nr:response regulator [Coprococcus catus]MDD6344152.1 response regulator [Coprococcus catus]MDY5989968.1 response regulator [Coprococcus catus]
MVKVYLVEDEIIIRQSIKNSIDWEKEGYEFVGDASDGELALPVILKEKPDILITDIRMPFMDGLELSRMVKAELPDIKIVILSGYDDFEYAKQAIKIGVAEYLLKPVSSAVLLEHLSEIAEKVRDEREDLALKKVYYQEMQENEELIKMKFLGELISGKLSLADAMEKGKRFHMNLSGPFYRIILFKFIQEDHVQAEQSEALAEAYEAVGNYVDGLKDAFRFQRGVEGWAFLLTSVEEDMEAQTERFIEGLKEVIAPFEALTWFGGIGSEAARLRELRYSFREADKAFAGRFVQEPNQIISVEQLNYEQLDNEFDANIFGEINQFDQIITRFLSSGSREEVESFVGALFTEISEDHFRSLMIRQYIIMDIYATVLAFCKKLRKDTGADGEAAGQMESLRENEEILKRAVLTAESVDDIKDYIGTLLDHVIELRNTLSGRRYSDIIRTARKRIEQDYMSEDISLNTVAAEVCMSPSYFSSVFSKEMGKTFIEYLTEVRMEKAKQYLVCSSMKTSEISYEVGYKDPHYFSYIFKKTQGCTPKEYRAARKG